MTEAQENPRRRERRRVRRRSDAEHIDRSVDDPRHGFDDELVSDDAERPVPVDDDQVEEPVAEEFWNEERPPHHGD